MAPRTPGKATRKTKKSGAKAKPPQVAPIPDNAKENEDALEAKKKHVRALAIEGKWGEVTSENNTPLALVFSFYCVCAVDSEAV